MKYAYAILKQKRLQSFTELSNHVLYFQKKQKSTRAITVSPALLHLTHTISHSDNLQYRHCYPILHNWGNSSAEWLSQLPEITQPPITGMTFWTSPVWLRSPSSFHNNHAAQQRQEAKDIDLWGLPGLVREPLSPSPTCTDSVGLDGYLNTPVLTEDRALSTGSTSCPHFHILQGSSARQRKWGEQE